MKSSSSSFSSRPKVALVHEFPRAGGGPEAITMRLIEVLRESCELDLITYRPRIDLKEFNAFYATDVKEDDFSLKWVRPPSFTGADALRRYRITRYAQDVAGNYDLMFSCYNAMDFKVPGLQYILDPNFSNDLLRRMKADSLRSRWRYRDSILRRLYLRAANSLARATKEGLRKNRTLADSRWTAELIKTHLGMESTVVYPPVLESTAFRPWKEREEGFVALGRLSPDKNYERSVEIIRACRSRRPDLHLHIIGRDWSPSYTKELEAKIAGDRDWVFLEKNLTSSDKNLLIAEHKFGIHGKACEPFGISVAELAKAGCLVWVPDDGGQVEIVDHPELIYGDERQAVAKIIKALENESLQTTLRDHLAIQARKFTVERFKSDIRAAVEFFLGEGL